MIALPLAAVLLGTAPIAADVRDPDPDVVEKLGELVPRDLVLRAEDGSDLRVGSLLDGRRPVVLTLGYFRCEQLCSVTLRGQMEALKGSRLVLGDDYVSVTVSISEEETPAIAEERRTHWLEAFGRPEAEEHWRFLTGDPASVRALADAVGFGYDRVPGTSDYRHPAVIVVLAPDGRVSRYLYGVRFPGRDVRLALVEAANGRVGTSFDRVLLTCMRWDPASRRYRLFVSRFLQTGGLVVLACVGALLVTLWRRELRR